MNQSNFFFLFKENIIKTKKDIYKLKCNQSNKTINLTINYFKENMQIKLFNMFMIMIKNIVNLQLLVIIIILEHLDNLLLIKIKLFKFQELIVNMKFFLLNLKIIVKHLIVMINVVFV